MKKHFCELCNKDANGTHKTPQHISHPRRQSGGYTNLCDKCWFKSIDEEIKEIGL